jgi:hypothetical protein
MESLAGDELPNSGFPPFSNGRVVVRDSQGKTVENLTKADRQLTAFSSNVRIPPGR